MRVGTQRANAIVIGMVLAAFVLLIFLHSNWKVTLIISCSGCARCHDDPFFYYVLKMSFNIMTLGGMAWLLVHHQRRFDRNGGTHRPSRSRHA